jgi:hypothetical protein
MSMSRDRVKFFLPYRYFQNGRGGNGMAAEDCQKVLLSAFDITMAESASLMVMRPEGFWIVCRPSQFARFIIRRHEWGDCINGIRDLKPELIDNYREKDWYEVVGDKLGLSRGTVERVADALGFNEDCTPPRSRNLIDVAARPHQRCYS